MPLARVCSSGRNTVGVDNVPGRGRRFSNQIKNLRSLRSPDASSIKSFLKIYLRNVTSRRGNLHKSYTVLHEVSSTTVKRAYECVVAGRWIFRAPVPKKHCVLLQDGLHFNTCLHVSSSMTKVRRRRVSILLNVHQLVWSTLTYHGTNCTKI